MSSGQCHQTALVSARALLEQGQADSALTVLGRVVSECSNSAEYHGLTGFALEKKGAFPRAAKEFYTAIRLAPRHSPYYCGLAQVLLQNNAHGEARVLLLEANKEFPAELWTYLLLAVLYRRTASSIQAEEILRKALERWPSNPQAHVLLGNILAGTGKSAEAITEFEKAIELDGRLSQAYLFYGIELDRTDRLEEAIAAFKKCLELTPAMANPHYYLGTIYLKQGQVPNAIEELHAAVALDPNYTLAYFRLGKAYQKVGQKAKANEFLQKYRVLSMKERSEPAQRGRTFSDALEKP